ncbi:MAG: PP2C family protein-serine/threonine phosphatase [Acidobacteriota bacterium]
MQDWAKQQRGRIRSFYDTYTKGLTPEEFQRVFTRDTREAYRYFTRGIDRQQLARLPWYKRPFVFLHVAFLAFTLKMSPARRMLFAVALIAVGLGTFQLLRGWSVIWVPIDPFVLRLPIVLPRWPDGTGLLILAVILLNLIVLLEVFERLSLKNDLEIARDIQQAMLPGGLYTGTGIEAFGLTRPANTVGGDFYDVRPLPDGRLMVAVGDVAGKGSPAALLMALLLAMMRTLLDEGLDAAALMERLNVQITRHAPASRFITLLFATIRPETGEVVSVNAGHLPGLIYRRSGTFERLTDGGIALGMFDSSSYTAQSSRLDPGDLLVLYSDGITEAEDPRGQPFDEGGLESLIRAYASEDVREIGEQVFTAVERHAHDVRFADDLTILLARRPVPGSEPPREPVRPWAERGPTFAGFGLPESRIPNPESR